MRIQYTTQQKTRIVLFLFILMLIGNIVDWARLQDSLYKVIISAFICLIIWLGMNYDFVCVDDERIVYRRFWFKRSIAWSQVAYYAHKTDYENFVIGSISVFVLKDAQKRKLDAVRISMGTDDERNDMANLFTLRLNKIAVRG